MKLVKNLEQTKIQVEETEKHLDETMHSLAEELLELLLQQIGDLQAIELILTMSIDMLSSCNNSKPIFRKGGKLQRRIKV